MIESEQTAHIENDIIWLRDKRVILDQSLAKLYNVETHALLQDTDYSDWFTDDYLFQLTQAEMVLLKALNIIPGLTMCDIQNLPYAFTEKGVAMIFGVLQNKGEIKDNVEIMRVFSKLRALSDSNIKLRQHLIQLEKELSAKICGVAI